MAGEGNENDTCGKCGKKIQSKAMKAKNVLYHEDTCFKCSICSADLRKAPVYSRDGVLYCERDYKNQFVPKCAGCMEFILENCVKAMDKTWHSEHFSCHSCQTNFSAAQIGYHDFEGKAYCGKCYNRHCLPKCKGCSQPIMDKTIKAMGGQWHVDCLVCKDCKKNFEGQTSIYSVDEKPICGACAGVN